VNGVIFPWHGPDQHYYELHMSAPTTLWSNYATIQLRSGKSNLCQLQEAAAGRVLTCCTPCNKPTPRHVDISTSAAPDTEKAAAEDKNSYTPMVHDVELSVQRDTMAVLLKAVAIGSIGQQRI